MKIFILQLPFILAKGVETAVEFGKEGGEASLNVHSGSDFVVRLATNPTTGYDWSLGNALPSCVSLKSKSYEKPKSSGKIGGGSILQLTYTTSGVCAGEMEYIYGRAWEKESPSSDSVPYVNIQVSVIDGIEL